MPSNGVYDDEDLDQLGQQEQGFDPAQAHYDEQFAGVTGKKNMSRTGESKGKSVGELERGAVANSSGINTPVKTDVADKTSPAKARFAAARNKYQSLKQRALKNKILVGVGAAGIGALALIAVLIIVVIGALKIPHLMENVTSYRFARVAQRATVQNERTFRTKISTQIADNKTLAGWKETYKGSRAKALYDKTERWSPNRTVKNLQTNNMQYNTTTTSLGFERLKSITINGQEVEKPKLPLKKRIIPGAKFLNDARFARQFVPEANAAMRVREVGPVVRGLAGYKLAKRLGISYRAWTVGQFKGLSSKEVAARIAQDQEKATATKAPADAVSEEIKEKTKDVDKGRAADLADPERTAQGLRDGVAPSTVEIIDTVGKDGPFKTVVGAVSPIYAVAAPICIIYDGSINSPSAGDTIDRNTDANMKAYYYYSSADSHIKDGNNADLTAARAMSEKLGDDLQSSAIMQANSGKVGDTGGTPNTNAGSAGIFTAFDALFGQNGVSDAADFFAGKVCPVATDIKVAVAVAAASLLTGGTANVGEQLIGKGVGEASKIVVKNLVKNAVKNLGLNQPKGARKLFFREGLKAGALVGATEIAKIMVLTRSGSISANGFTKDSELVGAIDYGGEATAESFSQGLQYGAPMTGTDRAQALTDQYAFFRQQNSEKSTFERYFAFSNPNSLVSNAGMATYSTVHSGLLGKFSSGLQRLLSPKSISNSFASLAVPHALAAENGNGKADYGNVQFGWTRTEMALMDTDDFTQLENARILDESGKADEIEEKYGHCFTDTIGTLLSNEYIMLDESGKVIPGEGECSPASLGTTNNDYGPMMVFRWRVYMADSADIDEKNNLAVVEDTATEVAGENSGAGGKFRAATFNIRHIENSPPYLARLKLSTDVIKGTSSLYNSTDGGRPIDVVGLQEVRPDQLTALLKDEFLGTTNWGFYPDTADKKDALPERYEPNVIVWNKAKFTAVPGSESKVPIKYFQGNTENVPKIMLEDNVTKQRFWFINTHDPASVQRAGPNAPKYRMENAKSYVPLIKNLGKDGTPVFIVGDFNSPFNKPSNAYGNDPKNSAYCILTADGSNPNINFNSGLWNAYDAFKKDAKPQCPGPSNSENGNSIDHIYLSRSVNVTNWFRIKKGMNVNGSDHETIIADIEIPASSSGTGSTDGWDWPLSRNDWGGPFGYNVWGSCAVKCRHAGVDLSGTANDAVLAAHAGKVVSAKYVNIRGGSCKYEVVVQATGTPYWYGYQHMGTIDVGAGDEVTVGQKLGTVDSVGPTGTCGSGAHLHFSVERQASISSYSDGVNCDINIASCAKTAKSLPPLCFLDKGDRNYGSSVRDTQIKGSEYCNELLR